MISVSLDATAKVHPTVIRAVLLTKEPFDGSSLVRWAHLVALSIHRDRLAISLEAAIDEADPASLDPEGVIRWWRVVLRDQPGVLTWYYGKMPLTESQSTLDGPHLAGEVRRLQVSIEAIDHTLFEYASRTYGEEWAELAAARPPVFGIKAMLQVQWPEFPTVVDQGEIVVDIDENGQVVEQGEDPAN